MIDIAVGLVYQMYFQYLKWIYKSMRVNTDNTNQLHIQGQTLDDVDQFCYLGSIVSKNSGTE